MPPKRASAETRQTQIIDAAIRCFQHKGFQNTTVDDIAAEFGLSKGSIYCHYASKKDILVAVFHHLISRLFEGYEAVILSDAAAREKLIQAAKVFIDRLLKEYEVYRPLMVLWSAAYEDPALREISAELYRKGDEVIQSILSQGEKNGEFVIPDKAVVSPLLVAMCEGLLTRQILVNDLDTDKVEQGIAVLIERILPPMKKKHTGPKSPRIRKEVVLNTSARRPEGQWENTHTGNLAWEDIDVVLTIGLAIEGQEDQIEEAKA